MDAVRTAQRFTGRPVTILYRRTRREMPAAEEEIEGALEEGNILEELVSPLEVLREVGAGRRRCACARNALGAPGPDGRRSPVAVPGSEFTVPCDSVIVAVGQLPELAFLDGSRVARAQGRRRAGGRRDAVRRARGRLRRRRRGDRAGQHHLRVRRRPPGGRGNLRAPGRAASSSPPGSARCCRSGRSLEVKAVRARRDRAGRSRRCSPAAAAAAST